jgi:hypothetical protein
MLKEVRRLVAAHARPPGPPTATPADGKTAAPNTNQTEVTDATHPDR